MGNCLNILEESVIFLPSTALIVIVLLVWAQLQAGAPRFRNNKVDEDKKNMSTLFLVSAWIYVAILFALFAFALYVLNFKKCAIGFFGLAFLITVASVGLASFRTFLILLKPEYTGVKIDRGSRELKKLLFITFIGVVGLGILSFSFAFTCLYWWTGALSGILVVIAIVYVLKKMFKSIRKKE